MWQRVSRVARGLLQQAPGRLSKNRHAVHVPGLLDRGQLDAALKAWEWSLGNPTKINAPRLKRDGTPLFYADSFSPRVMEGYGDMLAASPIPAPADMPATCNHDAEELTRLRANPDLDRERQRRLAEVLAAR